MATMNLLTAAFSGKLGKTVGQKWKNKNVIKSAVDGKAPPNQAQTNALLTFGILQRIIRKIQIVIQPYISNPSPKMTIQNKWVHESKEAVAGGIFNPSGIKGPKGTLETFRDLVLVYNRTTGIMHGERNRPAGWTDTEGKFAFVGFWEDENLIFSLVPQNDTALNYTFNIGAGRTGLMWTSEMWCRRDYRTKKFSQLVTTVATVITSEGEEPSKLPIPKTLEEIETINLALETAPEVVKPKKSRKKVIDTPEGA